jgi:hypothetical protein
MKYLPLLLVFFLFSCQSKQERLFEEFETLVLKVTHLDKRLSELDPKDCDFAALEVSDTFYGDVLPNMDITFEFILNLNESLSEEYYYRILDIIQKMKEHVEHMEKIIDSTIDSAKQGTIAMMVLFFDNLTNTL